MNTATPSLEVITPIKALWHWASAIPVQPRHVASSTLPAALPGSRCANALRSQILRAQPITANQTGIRRPLRLVRVMEAGQTPAQVGRMVISGRLADVCAELDRLVACEAHLH